MTAYQIGPDSGSLEDTVDVFGIDPRGYKYREGAQRMRKADGHIEHQGYPRITWTLKSISVSTFNAALSTLGFSAGDYSADVVIHARARQGAWATCDVIMIIPDEADLERWGAEYQDIELEFIVTDATYD